MKKVESPGGRDDKVKQVSQIFGPGTDHRKRASLDEIKDAVRGRKNFSHLVKSNCINNPYF